MFCVTILGSGSAGNCAFVETERTRLLIDGGLSARQMVARLARCGINPLEIDAILVTHEHSDHMGGLNVWCRQFATPVFANALTIEILKRDIAKGRRDWRTFITGSDFSIKDITVQSFTVPHDAVDPVGFVLHHGRQALGFLTDLGFATKLVQERVRAVQTLVIETNHDEKLLQNDTRRPWAVKQRIMSRHGHLSNAAAGAVIAGLADANLQRAVLGHLSRDCNTPQLALGTIRNHVDGAAIEVFCATQGEVSPRFSVG